MITRQELTPIGQFRRTHALKGELNAVLDIEIEDLAEDAPLIVEMDGIFVPFYPESVRPKAHFSYLVKLQGVDSEEQASRFVNKEIYARKIDVIEEERPDGEGEYVDDLVGYTIVDDALGIIGKVAEVDLTTDNALFIVMQGDRKIFIPAVDELIESIDPERLEIVMRLPEGLVDLNS